MEVNPILAKRQRDAQQPQLFEAKVPTAPCVPVIRKAVAAWREDNKYPGITETTRTLLNHWFLRDHKRPDGRRFAYHPAQREAIETLVFLWEVEGVRRQKQLVEKYSETSKLRLSQYDDFARYCIKMATGSGKTKVVALAAAWQYFNAVAEGRDDYARTSLVIAPNVIVFERLRSDFEGGKIFNWVRGGDPVIPPELEVFWDFECYLRGEAERASSQGALYLTNIQQLYDRENQAVSDEPEPIADMLGPKPPSSLQGVEDFERRIVARNGPVLVVNDEAHHTHEDDSEWNKVIRKLHQDAKPGLSAQIDFSATPRFSKGALFTWTVYDYPLKQAIIDGIVKRPMKGIAKGITEQRSDVASTRYASYLTAGVERWREYRDLLAKLGKKPILFVMMNDTDEANDVGDDLRRKYPSEFGGDKLQIIHTNMRGEKAGEVSERELENARKLVREVDQATSPVNAIVSVLMLREGWDVQNVTVVVGLRPYTSKANILPEQTIGRGLRLMFRDSVKPLYQERVDVIGNKAFIDFVEQLEREENLELGTFVVGVDKLQIVTVAPDPAKLDKDIVIPVLSPLLTRKTSLADEIAALDVQALSCPPLPKKDNDEAAKKFLYEGYDIITLQKMIEREYTIPEAQTSQEVIAYYAKRIAQDVKLPSQFAALVPKVREFLETKAFGEAVNLDEPAMIKAIGSNVAQYVTVKLFAQALREVVVETLVPALAHPGRKLSDTPPFPFSRITMNATKTVFNLVACENDFEREFADFLEGADDVAAFAKLPERFGFSIEYTDASANLRYYEPDFVVVTKEGQHYLVETKGREDVDVQHKDRAAQLWCDNATQLTGVSWQYVKVQQTEYAKLQADDFADLSVLGQKALL